MEVERLWSREPGWFAQQSPAQRTRLLAWHRLHSEQSLARVAGVKALHKWWTRLVGG